MDAPSRSTEFAALGQPGFENLAGLETFPNPGVSRVELTSDELTAICPVTGQPDLYVAAIEYQPGPLCIESKSLKLYLHGYRNEGHFCEALAVRIRDDHLLDVPARHTAPQDQARCPATGRGPEVRDPQPLVRTS